MTGFRLFLKSRRAISLMVVLVSVAVVGKLLGPRGLLVGQENPLPLPWAVLLPMISSYAVAGCSPSPMPWLEMLAQRNVATLSRWFLLVAIAAAVPLLWWSTHDVPPPLSAPAVVRNFAGLLGLSLIGVAFLGVSVGWMIPAGWMFSAVVLRGGDVDFLPIDWLVRSDLDRSAATIALVLMVAGLGMTWTRPLRNAPSTQLLVGQNGVRGALIFASWSCRRATKASASIALGDRSSASGGSRSSRQISLTRRPVRANNMMIRMACSSPSPPSPAGAPSRSMPAMIW